MTDFTEIDYKQVELRILNTLYKRVPWYKRLLCKVWHKISKRSFYKFIYGGNA